MKKFFSLIVAALIAITFAPANGQSVVLAGQTVHTVTKTFPLDKGEVTYAITLQLAYTNASPSAFDSSDLEAWGNDILEKMNEEFGDKFLDKENSPSSPKVQRKFSEKVIKIANKYFEDNEISGVGIIDPGFERARKEKSKNGAFSWVPFVGKKPNDGVPIKFVRPAVNKPTP